MKLNYAVIIALVGLIIGAIAFFAFNLVETEGAFGDVSGFKGYEIITQDGGEYTAHVLAIMVSLVGVVIMAVLEFMGKGNNHTRFLTLLFGAIIAIVGIMIFLERQIETGLGGYLTIASGILILLASFAMIYMGRANKA